MPDDAFAGERRVGPEQLANEHCERIVLRVRVRSFIRALELDTDGEVIALGPAFVLRLAGVPGPRIEGNVLDELSVTTDEHVGRHPQSRDGLEVRMRSGRQAADEEVVDPGSPELSGRETDPVHDDELGHRACRPRVEMR